MFIKVLLALCLMIVFACSPTISMRSIHESVINSNNSLMADILERKIVEYYYSHGNNLPASVSNCVNKDDLKLMGLDSYDDYSNNAIFNYNIIDDSSFSLLILNNGNIVYQSRLSNKRLDKANLDVL